MLSRSRGEEPRGENSDETRTRYCLPVLLFSSAVLIKFFQPVCSASIGARDCCAPAVPFWILHSIITVIKSVARNGELGESEFESRATTL